MSGLDKQKIKKLLEITFNWERANFLKNAYKRGKNYGGFDFLFNELREHFNIFITGKFENAYLISKKISALIRESDFSDDKVVNKFLKFTFHCFSKISNRTFDRKDHNGKKLKGNKQLLNQILNNKTGKLFRTMHDLKHLFIKLEWIPEDFMFGNLKFVLKTKLS